MNNTTNRRLLIVDDQKAIHEDFRKILDVRRDNSELIHEDESILFGETDTTAKKPESIEYEIDSAYQGEDAIEMVIQATKEDRPYAVAFVDVRMPPGIDGVETIQSILESDDAIEIVMCSAYSDYTFEEIQEKLASPDRFLILKKPFENVEVRQLASSLTERWANNELVRTTLNRR